MGSLAYRRIFVPDVCEVERGQAGRVYPAGTCYVALSATNDTVNQLREPSEIDGRYAALVPRDARDGDYLRVVLERAFSRWLAAHRTGINLKLEELATLAVEWHEDAGTRREVTEACRRLDELARAEEATAAGLSDVKQYLLLRMFC